MSAMGHQEPVPAPQSERQLWVRLAGLRQNAPHRARPFLAILSRHCMAVEPSIGFDLCRPLVEFGRDLLEDRWVSVYPRHQIPPFADR